MGEIPAVDLNVFRCRKKLNQDSNMLEYCSVAYAWIGRGWTQEIAWLRIDGEEVVEWRGKYWTDFLNDMARQRWELVAVASLGGGENSNYGIAAYFKRSI